MLLSLYELCFISFPVSDDICPLLIAFTSSLDPDQGWFILSLVYTGLNQEDLAWLKNCWLEHKESKQTKQNDQGWQNVQPDLDPNYLILWW